MGRTATAFLVLVMVGGCVADNQGPPAAYQTAQKDQSPAAASCYATWSKSDQVKSDQFAALHDDGAVLPPPTASLAATPTMARMTVAAAPKQMPAPKPLPPALTGEVLPPLGGPTPALAHAPTTPEGFPITAAATTPSTALASPTTPAASTTSTTPAIPTAPPTPTDFIIDSELARATMVQTPPDRPEVVDTHPAKVPSKTDKAKKTEPEGELASAVPGSPTVRMVNTKRITLNYKIKDMEASGVSGVELWRTRDAHTWERGEIVAQTNHSFLVEVKEEGLHGFTLLARNGNDAGKQAPAAGEHPQIWVMVDFTKPVVQITGVEVAHGGKTPTVQLHWTAKDKNLGFRPITLSYAEQMEGPWTTIAAAVENSGHYEWQSPTNAPHRLFLRVEAADMAGNVAAVQTANALRLDAALTVATPAPATTPSPTGDAKHQTASVPSALDMSHPTAAILDVEPNGK
jgi:hypothetical protein